MIDRRLVLGVLLAAPAIASAATLRVPSDYARIYEALDAAAANDTVLVAPGIYTDISVRNPFGTVASLGFILRPVVLRSEAGASATILDLSSGEGLANYVAGIWMDYGNTGSVLVQGFRVVGYPPPPTVSNGVAARLSSNVWIEDCEFEIEDSIPSTTRRDGVSLIDCQDTVVRRCKFTNCRHGAGADGTGTLVEQCEFRGCQDTALSFGFEGTRVVRDCLFDSNAGGGVNSLRGLIERCWFVNNTDDSYGGALSCGFAEVRECVFIGNWSPLGGGGVSTGQGTSTVEGCTFIGNYVTPGTGVGAAIRATASSIQTLRNNVIVGSFGGPAVGRGANGTIIPSCNVFWQNLDGDAQGFELSETDHVVDPQFCDPVAGDYTVRDTSPCLPEHSPGCGQIGAFGEGCGTVSVIPETWANIKSRFRELRGAGEGSP